MRLHSVPLFIFLIVWSAISTSIFAQFGELDGYPLLKNFEPEEYDGHVQNWAFTQDSSGIIYVANRMNVLVYYGTRWEAIPIPNSYVVSIEFINNRVYVGGAGEFGYLAESTDENMVGLQYYSLSNKLPDTLSFGNIWYMKGTRDFIYFNNDKYLFRYNLKTESVDYWEPKLRFYAMFEMEGHIYIKQSADDLYLVKGDIFEPVGEKSFFEGFGLRNWVRTNEKELFCSTEVCFEKDGENFIPFETDVDQYLMDNVIDEVIHLRNGTLLFATRQGGIVNVSIEGKLLHILDKDHGLISNTVYGLFEDNNGSVWVATNNGLSRIEYSLPLRLFDHRSNLTNYNYELLEYKDDFITSGSNGIHFYNRSTGKFDVVKVDGECRELTTLFDDLYTSCGSSLYRISNKLPKRITGDNFAVNQIIPLNNDHLVYISNSLNHVIGYLKDEVEVLNYVKELKGSPTSIYQDESGNIWTGSLANGLNKVSLTLDEGQVTGYNVQNYLSDFENPDGNKAIYITELNKEAAFLTWGKGILRYDEGTNQLKQETRFGEEFSDTTIQYFKAVEDNAGNIWFRSNSAYQVAWNNQDGSYTYDDRILSRLPSGQIHTIYPDGHGNIWYSIGTSLIRLNPTKPYNLNRAYHTRINKVLVRGDSLINGGRNLESDVLKYSDNELRFTYSAASYDEPEKTKFRVKLEGFDERWSTWTTETQKDYTNIPEGDYSFKVQARNNYGVLSAATPFNFSVLPPWYRTWWAYVLYTIAVFGGFYTGFKIRLNQLMRVERIRTRIASDLHDEVSATLTGISFFAEAVGRDQDEVRKEHFISLIKESAGDAKEKITDIVWSINPENDDWSLFLAKCRRYASDLLESSGLDYTLNIIEHIPGKITMEIRQHLWMIFKEMLTNVVRHSGAKRLDVILDYKEQTLILVIQDNGKGFDKKKVDKGGDGLQNIRRRASILNAELSLDSEPQIGTRWTMKMGV